MKATPRHRRWWASAITACALTAAAASVASPAHAAVTRASHRPDLSGITLRVGYGLVRDSSTQDIRLASGAFDHTPYAIKWASFPSSTATLEALNAGAIDVTPDTQATAVIVAQAGAKTPWTRSSAPLKIVGASVPPTDAGVVIGVHTGSGIKKIADLKGKKVTYVPGGPSQLYWSIAAKEIFPNTTSHLSVLAAINMANALLLEASFSFVGLGVQPPRASWGTILQQGYTYIYDAFYYALFPALAIVLVMLLLNVIARSLQSATRVGVK